MKNEQNLVNKMIMKRFLSLKMFFESLLILVSVNVSAYDFKVGDFYYNVLSFDDLTCEVTNNGNGTGIPYLYEGELIIPEKVEYNGRMWPVVEIGLNAFSSTDIERVVINGYITTVGMYAFSWCDYLKEAVIGNSVVSLERSAFMSCGHLEKVWLGSSLTYISDKVFTECPKLMSIYSLNATPPRVNSEAFENSTFLNATLYVPKGCLEAYQNAAYWKNFTIKEFETTGINTVVLSKGITEVARYSIDGKRLAAPQKGLNIVMMSDGSKRKEWLNDINR